MEISIIIPVYNKIRYLDKILGMIANQTFRDFECILVDDGSTDGSGIVCDRFAEKDRRFIALHTSNGGVSHARNVGLDLAQGKYITFIDADDEIKENFIDNLYQCIKLDSVDMVISWFAYIFPTGKIVKKDFPMTVGKYNIQEIMPSFCKLQMESGIFGWCWAKLFKKEFVKNIRFNEELKLAEDFDFYMNLYSKIETIYFDEMPYYYYRQEAENSSVTSNDEEIDYLAQLKINLHYRKFLQLKGVWNGENQRIVEQLLSNYAYFTLFHSPSDAFDSRFEQLYDTCMKESVPLRGHGAYQKIMLGLLKKHHGTIAKMTMKSYRNVRRMVKGLE